tara:strand:+ start:839 stop:2449 length:1611 start_codon:yes stop_codon:yes gene_type:complete
MAINLGLNIKTNSKSNQTVNVSASSGVTLASISSTNKRLTVSATEDVAKELCTVTFTAGTNFYYSQEPDFVENFNDATFSFTSSVTKNSLGRVITKTFVISATASISSIYNILTFSEKINVSSTAGANNTVLKQINSIEFDKSNVPSSGSSRVLTVRGLEKTKFSIKLTRSSDSKTYDFDTNQFTTTATTSSTKEISNSGIVNTTVQIPSTSAVETYTLETTADEASLSTLQTGLRDTAGSRVNTFTFNQSSSVTVTFTCVSADSSYTGTHGALPSSGVITGVGSAASDGVEFIVLEPKLHTKAFKRASANTPLISQEDFEIRTTQAMSGNTTGTTITLTAANDTIVQGMTVTGTGITNTVTVASIEGTALVLSGTPGGTVSGTLTFTGAGYEFIQLATGLEFDVENQATGVKGTAFLNIENVSKTANANSTGNTITLANAESDSVGSVVGIYAEVSQIDNGPGAEGVVVIAVDSSQNTITVSGTPTISSGQVLNFTGAGRKALIEFKLTITQFPTKNTTVSLNLDNFLTIDPNWS